MEQNSSIEQEDRKETLEGDMSRKRKFLLRMVLVVFFICLGIAGKFGLAALYTDPPPVDMPPPRIRVEVGVAQPEDVQVNISGYGEVRSLDSVAITPKVAGEVMHLHPALDVGNVIPEGELLYRLDQRDYLAAREQAEAQVERLKVMLSLLRRQFELSQVRLETARRTHDIALEEFKRDSSLYEKQDVGSQSMVNLSEINYQRAKDAFEQVDHALELFPLQIREAESGLKAAQAALKMAELSLERTEYYAPFNARVQHKQIEVGQAVAPGVVVLLLADDSTLEISVPIDSRDARRWLPFLEEDRSDAPNWFRPLAPVACRITWTEDSDAHAWNGTLHRVERFDHMTRTVTVAVRVDEDTRLTGDDSLPLVEGMFCQLEIPGRTMRNVYRLPRWAVSFDGFVFIAEGEHLRRRYVEVVRTQGEETFIEAGLEPGELVVLTRLVNPVPGILIEYDAPDEAGEVARDAEAPPAPDRSDS